MFFTDYDSYVAIMPLQMISQDLALIMSELMTKRRVISTSSSSIVIIDSLIMSYAITVSRNWESIIGSYIS